MDYDPDDPKMQQTLTRLCKILADPNSRRVIEILASEPGGMTLSALHEHFDVGSSTIITALEPMLKLDLVSGGCRAGYRSNIKGLRLLRSWIDSVGAKEDESGH
jgi:hypothetical protein